MSDSERTFEQSTFEKDDLFDRKYLADGLTSLIKNNGASRVYALDGEWGSGKSHFLDLWRNELAAEYPVVFLNAFEHDLSGDAFSTVSAKILELHKAWLADQNHLRKLLHTASKVGKGLLRAGLEIGVRAGSAGIISSDATNAMIDETVQATSENILKTVSDRINEASELETAIQSLRIQIAEIPELVAKNKTTELRPVVFIIDELDRCRPDFAIDLLECVKHFFNAENVHFVIGLNSRALGAMIERRYGRINGIKYLSRFFNLTLKFKDIYSIDSNAGIEKYFSTCWSRIAGDNKFHKQSAVFYTALRLSTLKNFTLRDIEKLVEVLASVLILSKAQQSNSEIVLTALCAMKIDSPDLYAAAQKGKLTLAEFLEWSEITDSADRHTRRIVEHFRALLSDPFDETDRETLSEIIPYGNRSRVIPAMVNNVIEAYSPEW